VRRWASGPTGPWTGVYPVLSIDAIVVEVRDGQVTNTPFYVVMGVSCAGDRDILGIWAGDGLTGLPDAIGATWESTQVQT